MLTKMKIHRLTLIFIVGLSLGWLIGLLLYDWNWFQYEQKFNLFELLYFVITGCFALFITHRIEKTIQDKRSQKELIIEKIKEVDNAIKELKINFIFDSSNNKYKIQNTNLLSQAKSITMWAKRYETSVQEYYQPLFQSECFFKIGTRQLVRICTYTSPRTNNVNLQCVSGEWLYSEDKYVEIMTEIERLRDICYRNALLLNKQ